jgi:isoprenylcysteine carboxyl methyltransferase (ICMT) family protein YpbQ
MSIISVFAITFCVRLISLFISIRNEKQLKLSGAHEYGKLNTLVLTLGHIAFYVLAITEGIQKQVTVNNYTYAGICFFAFSMLILFMVIQQLGKLWTVKLIIAPNHQVNKSLLFRVVRHPNYFLNVIPELVAIALICQSWNVLMLGMPLYLIPLGIRIYQEENIMKEEVSGYN